MKLQNNQAILPVKTQELVAFLYSTFETTPGQPIKLNRDHFAGRFITGVRSYSDTPLVQTVPCGWISVVVEFPEDEHSTADRHFCYFSREHIICIHDVVKASFDLFFHVYFYDTSDLNTFEWGQMGMTEVSKLFLVESFIVGMGLVDMDTAHETIKKREYRKELAEWNRKRQQFLKKDYRFRKRIHEKRRENLQNILKEQLKK
jgi:hypothetical protein